MRAAALLRGDPNFERFLSLVATAKDDMESELSNFETIGNHAVMAWVAGRIDLCKEILSASQSS